MVKINDLWMYQDQFGSRIYFNYQSGAKQTVYFGTRERDPKERAVYIRAAETLYPTTERDRSRAEKTYEWVYDFFSGVAVICLMLDLLVLGLALLTTFAESFGFHPWIDSVMYFPIFIAIFGIAGLSMSFTYGPAPKSPYIRDPRLTQEEVVFFEELKDLWINADYDGATRLLVSAI